MPEARPRHTAALRALVAGFAVVAAAFMTSSFYADREAREIEAEAADIEKNSVPSLEHLNDARTALRHLETEADQFAEQSIEQRSEARVEIDRAHAELNRAITAYLATPAVAQERALYPDLTLAIDELETSLERLFVLGGEKDDAKTMRFADADVRPHVEALDGVFRRLGMINADGAHEAATRIASLRRRSTWVSFGLDSACLALAIVTAIIATRALRRQSAVERAHAELLERRAEELEMFAKRVAHDLLSPLSSLSFSLATVRRTADKGQPVAEPIARANACLKRAQRLVDGVFDFARAGAAPASRGRADVREAIDGVLDEVRDGEGDSVDFAIAPFDDVAVACAPGVLTSVLSNLVRNAVKYMPDRGERRVAIRVAATETLARVEVEDTAGGLAPEVEAHLFEPYVRGPESAQPGLGLGLSTVRRFVEAHGGRVGVQSVRGRGCTFWFELPRVGGDADAPAPRAARYESAE